MAISFRRYIDIVSRVGGAAAALTRELIGRIFVDNPLLPGDMTLYFTTPESVGLYFGTDSQEYKRARFYFSFVGKQATTPKKLSFARWNINDTAPAIYGGASQGLVSFQSTTAGDFYLTIGGVTNYLSGLDFTTATSMADVATILQAAINAFADPNFATATVTYNATTGGFDLVGGVVATSATIEIGTVNGDIAPNFLGNVLAWDIVPPNLYRKGAARAIAGLVHQQPSYALEINADADNNFGSFLFMDPLTEDQIVEVAAANDARNVEFLFTIPALVSDYLFTCTALEDNSGVCVTILDGDAGPVADEYPEMMPMVILAATDYNRPDAAQNYMYQEANLTPVVLTTDLSLGLDGCRVNYYGATQQAGRLIAFYQRGYMHGETSDPLDMNTYANEIWLKDNIGVELINILLTLGKVSANKQGRATVITAVQVAVDRALFNGVISVGKPLTNTQKAYITSITNQADAWRQVQNVGYWLDCFIEQYTGPGGGPEYKARYVLIYAKDDVIRKIEGADILI
jgi:hypothetical protein